MPAHRIETLSAITGVGLLVLCSGWLAPASISAQVEPVKVWANVSENDLPAVSQAARVHGWAWSPALRQPMPAGNIGVLWFSGSRPADAVGGWTDGVLDPWLREGGGLLVYTGRDCGPEDAFALKRLLPTSAWHSIIHRLHRGKEHGSLVPVGGDPAFFGRSKWPEVTLDYHYDIRPRPAVEGGNWRYERFSTKDAAADNDLWSRPIVNRDPRVRLWGAGPIEAPLVVTGRYGAGRVAVIAAGPEALSGPGVADFYQSVLAWLADGKEDGDTKDLIPRPATASETPSVKRPVWASSAGGWQVRAELELPARQLVFQLENAAASQELEMVLRIATWERAPIEDRILHLKPDATGRVVVDLPAPGLESVDALDMLDAFWIRLGLLENGGRTVALESPWFYADATPSAQVEVQAASIDASPYPFAASGLGTLFWKSRLGAHVGQFAFPPGMEVEGAVHVSNALRNLAPAATVRDLQRQDHTRARVLNDLAYHGKTPRDNVEAWGTWGPENPPHPAGVRFAFSEPVVISGLALYGDAGGDPFPPSVTIQVRGETIAVDDLTARMEQGRGRAWIDLPEVTAAELDFLFPAQSAKARIAEIGIFGRYASEKSTPLTGSLVAQAINGVTGKKLELVTQQVELVPGTSRRIPFRFAMPDPGPNLGLWRIEASWAGTRAGIPIMGIRADKALKPRESLQSKQDVFHNFIVTRGLRNSCEPGTGNRDAQGAWGTPDDMVYAHARMLKQTKWSARMNPTLQFTTDTDFAHYVNPWTDFPNGEPYFKAVAPGLLSNSKQNSNWAGAERVVFGFSDRWDPGPATDQLFTWPRIIAFDESLRAAGGAGLQGRTRIALSNEILERHNSDWHRFNEKRYVDAVGLLKETYRKEGKTLVITAQGKPLLSKSSAPVVAEVVQGMSDDSTWELHGEDIPFTTSRQMAALAWNPEWRYSTLLQWGWNSCRAIWHAPVGTAEPSRRHYYDRAWRGIRLSDGSYRSMHTYGFNQNGYESWTMTGHDWQQWWNLKERHALIDPQAPLGAALVVSTSRYESKDAFRFSGGGMGGNELADVLDHASNVQAVIQRAGVSIPYSANARNLGSPVQDRALVLVGLAGWTEQDLRLFDQWMAEKRPIIAAQGEAGEAACAALIARLEKAAGDQETIGEILGKPVRRFGSVLLFPVTESALAGAALAGWEEKLRTHLKQQVVFPPGTAGYAFRRGGQALIVVEDWLERPRTVEIRLEKSVLPGKVRAVSLNRAVSLGIREEGDFYIARLPLRNGDGDVVVWEVLP